MCVHSWTADQAAEGVSEGSHGGGSRLRWPAGCARLRMLTLPHQRQHPPPSVSDPNAAWSCEPLYLDDSPI